MAETGLCARLCYVVQVLAHPRPSQWQKQGCVLDYVMWYRCWHILGTASSTETSLCVNLYDTGVGTPQAQPVAETRGHQSVQGREQAAGIPTRGSQLACVLLAQWVSKLVFNQQIH